MTQAEDNDYYLRHLYDGTYNKAGCLFADYENKKDFSDRNTIIYGHNMRDGSMFASLNEYKEQSYYDSHPQMYLVTPDGGYLCDIFAAFEQNQKNPAVILRPGGWNGKMTEPIRPGFRLWRTVPW